MYSNREREEYERWHRYGHERGWLQKMGDEVRSWFGDENAESRRRLDEREERHESGPRIGGYRNFDTSTSDTWTQDRWPNRSYDRSRSYGFDGQGRSLKVDRPDYAGATEGYYNKEMFRGRGPKSYMRADERIKDDICHQFHHNHDLDATDIDVEVKNQEVTLKGTVQSRLEKRKAEELAEDVYGVQNVHNTLRVAMNEYARETQPALEGTAMRSRTSPR